MSDQRRRLLIRQAKEWGEILIGFESRNRYEIFDQSDRRVGFAAEEGGGVGRSIARQFLGPCRKATLHVYGEDGAETVRAEKPFRFYFHRMDVYAGGKKVGAVQRRFSILHRRFVIENPAGEEVLQIHSPLFRVWTFKILFGEHEVGRVAKKWGGLLKEMFTDADVFGIEWDASPALDALQPVLVAATFLIDFTCFENNQGSGGFAWSVGD